LVITSLGDGRFTFAVGSTNRPARDLGGGVPEEVRMNKRAPELTYHVLQPAMHEKILVRAAELVATGWTRGTAARDATGQKVRSTAPQATAWCVVGHGGSRAVQAAEPRCLYAA